MEKKCLDKGFVRLVDVMGDDSSIVQAARVSYGEGTKTIREDKILINYLMEHEHTSPMEMIETKWHIKLPIFVARQWIRHRTASINEVSGRYSVLKNEIYVPKLADLTTQDTVNKQGSTDVIMNNPIDSIESYIRTSDLAFRHYYECLEGGLSKEKARFILPVATYTEWYWKIDLHNLFHFLKLRLDKHAQMEIRVYAEAIFDIIKEKFPLACAAFEEYKLNAIKLSFSEKNELKQMLLDNKLSDSVSKNIKQKIFS